MSKRTVTDEFLNDVIRLYEAIQELKLHEDDMVTVYSNKVYCYLEEKVEAMKRREEWQAKHKETR